MKKIRPAIFAMLLLIMVMSVTAWTRKAVRVCFCRLCRNSSERQSGSGAAEREQRREWGEAFSEEMEAERVAGRCVRVLRGIECPKFYTGRPVFQGFQKMRQLA